MSKILLVRHGQDEDNANGILNGHRDTPLTALGRQQASIVAQKLRDDEVEVILSSPLQRAFETATILAEELNIQEVITDELLKERDFGIMTGKQVADIPKLAEEILPTDKVNYFIRAEGVEEFPDLYKRAKSFLEKVLELYPNKTVVAVTHGDLGKMIRAAYHGWSWEDGLKTPYFKNTGVLHLDRRKDVLE